MHRLFAVLLLSMQASARPIQKRTAPELRGGHEGVSYGMWLPRRGVWFDTRGGQGVRFPQMTIPCWFKIVFWALAIVASVLLGVFCFSIHGDPSRNNPAHRIQQGWFNSLGSLFGWASLWVLLHQVWGIWRLSASPVRLTTSDLVLGLTAFIGISGYLPFTVMGVIHALVALVVRLVNRLTEWLTPPSA